MEQPWFRNPLHLFARNKILIFWPLAKQNRVERLNAATRFILYTMTVLFLLNRDVRVIYLGMTVILVMASMFLMGNVKEGMRPANFVSDGTAFAPDGGTFTAPTKDNPMGNVLMTDYVDNPKRASAAYYPTVKNTINKLMGTGVPRDQADVYSSRDQSRRAFYSMPSTTIPNDQEAFAKAAYGPVIDKVCRSEREACFPNDKSMFGQSRMPERHQHRAGGGGSVKA